jgi:hypothetical protein
MGRGKGLSAEAIDDLENVCKFLAIGRIPPLIGAAAIGQTLEVATSHDDLLADGGQVVSVGFRLFQEPIWPHCTAESA